MGHLYKSDDALTIAFRSYDRAMQLWSSEYCEEWIDTPFGRTHIIVSGPDEGKPLFLLPGLFADATMWFANAGTFSQRYRVYAVDLPVFGGKSEVSETPIASVGDYATWFGRIMHCFGHESAAVAGLSYGSWLSLALAREMPDAIAALAMLDPSETFARMDGGIAWKGFWSFVFFPNRAKYARFFAWLGGGYRDSDVDVWFEHMLDVIEHGSVGMFDVPQHRVYTPEELSMVRVPVLVMAGGKPILYKDPRKLAKTAQHALPQAEVEIVPGTGHSLNMERAREVNARVMRFLAENYD